MYSDREGITQSREKTFSKAVIFLNTALLIAMWENRKNR